MEVASLLFKGNRLNFNLFSDSLKDNRICPLEPQMFNN